MSKSRDIADSAATINYIDGLTSDAQTQIDTATSDIATNTSDIATKAPLSNPTFTGTVTATAFSGDGSGLTSVDSLPSQTGNSGLFLTTDGTDASWGEAGGGLQSIQVFTSSGTWTKPAGISKIIIRGVGGGGGGGGSVTNNYYCSSGGGAAGYFEKLIDVSAIASETVTIGAGGAGGVGTIGSTGGTTSFGSYASSNGGGGGRGANLSPIGGVGGTATGGDVNAQGGDGTAGAENERSKSKNGDGGASFFGGGGTSGANPSDVGQDGKAYGSGGGGGGTSADGGDGKAGIIIVEEYA